jgi:hypothetical protein
MPQADEPENPDESSSNDKPKSKSSDTDILPSDESSAISSSKDPMVPVTIKDEGEGGDKKAAPCSGAELPDLLASLSQSSCEVTDPNAEGQQRDVKDTLEIRVALDPAKVQAGAAASVLLTLKNKGKTPLTLDFAVDPEPRFNFEVRSKKGTRIDQPPGAEPPLPPNVANATPEERKIARITLAPQGIAKAKLPWTAVKYKWASKERAKGALPGHGYPRDPAGPLPKGKYVLRVVTPMVGVFEGVDHEITQPRTEIEIVP